MSRNMHRGRAPKSMGRTALSGPQDAARLLPYHAAGRRVLHPHPVRRPGDAKRFHGARAHRRWADLGRPATGPRRSRRSSPTQRCLAALYFASLICNALWQQCMAIITQGVARRSSADLMFDHMQDLPIRYFDTHQHGDVMSYYTNDIDTHAPDDRRRRCPSCFVTCSCSARAVFCIMLWYSLLADAAVVVVGVAIMVLLGKMLASRSAKHFVRTQQRRWRQSRASSEEMMNGQKVVKVFSHEDKIEAARSTSSTTSSRTPPARPTHTPTCSCPSSTNARQPAVRDRRRGAGVHPGARHAQPAHLGHGR